MESAHLTPGCVVTRRDAQSIVGRVVKSFRDDMGRDVVVVRWPDVEHPTREPRAKLIPGFKRGMHVQDVSRSRIRPSLGVGIVVALRELGGYHQVLVDFPDLHQQTWLPFENLKQVNQPKAFFQNGRPDSSERFRLRNLARAIEAWHENTGGLSHLDIDPLPHQIHLVHHILTSGNLNWLIADDVGLGKTVEVGMLLSALDHRKSARRVLVVCPAGLAKQWQEELRYKFGFEDYQIYGVDFHVSEDYQWRQHNHVIASIDRLKQQDHLQSIMQAEPWDLIVFDEAHRLSRRQYGMKLEASDRYAMAVELRCATDSLLLLSATPHQGMADKFAALLELLRPELKPEIDQLATAPEFLSSMVFRNQKAYVTDSKGHFIFNGKVTKTLELGQSTEEAAIDRALTRYLEKGYAAGGAGGSAGKAIGFVMTTYRKLAASSLAAIHRALERRHDTLLARAGESSSDNGVPDLEDADERFSGENEERLSTSRKEFFRGEISLLENLLDQLRPLLGRDQKLRDLMEKVLPQLLIENPDEKILIFSEYRATQDYVAEALAAKFGSHRVNLLNGSMSPPDRMQQIRAFESDGQFLISTEAGGEGINLQRHCHLMVNFDLPWNPMRLVQRIGRLYRYGQKKKVVIFNVMSSQTLDSEIINQMYTKLNRVVEDLSSVSAEYRGGDLEAEILGEFAEMVDVQEILEDAQRVGVARTQEEIEKALKRARSATSLQRELFTCFASFNPQEAKEELAITLDHVRAFVLGMCKELGIEVRSQQFKGRAFELVLPNSLQEALRSNRRLRKITFDRSLAQTHPQLELMDLNSSLLQLMLQRARNPDFGGHAANIQLESRTAVVTAMLRWQNDQGRLLRQEFSTVSVDDHGSTYLNEQSFADWLLQPAADAPLPHDRSVVDAILEAAELSLNRRLAKGSGKEMFPANLQWVAGARASS
jgi:ERCC4-related helicase